MSIATSSKKKMFYGESKPIDVLPIEECLLIPCIGVRWKGEILVIAAPENNWEQARNMIKNYLEDYELINSPAEDILDLLNVIDIREADGKSAEKYQTVTGEAPVSKLIDDLLEQSISFRSSDLHIEPFENIVRIRIRVDGLLKILTELPINLSPAIVSRIKVLSKLNIVERRRPQDGQFTAIIGTRRVDIRVATSATVYGEKVVLRLHDEKKPLVGLSELGMNPNQLVLFRKSLISINGLILAAGPTGSGKTTTLHSALKEIHSSTKNITTIEDPVEYIVPEINQIPVQDGNGMGFASQLRAILRQDPDVILVGETRDAETARISIQAALTGHLVLSSIHANDAVGAVYRLMQMDIEPYLVASSLKSVVSQRLIRKICTQCKVSYTPSRSENLLLTAHNLPIKKLSRGEGCSFCIGTGYRDRVAAYQVLTITEKLSELISTRPDPSAFRKIAVQEGLTTIAQEAMNLAVAGITSLNDACEFLDNHES